MSSYNAPDPKTPSIEEEVAKVGGDGTETLNDAQPATQDHDKEIAEYGGESTQLVD
jgi:hypothetical protein